MVESNFTLITRSSFSNLINTNRTHDIISLIVSNISALLMGHS